MEIAAIGSDNTSCFTATAPIFQYLPLSCSVACSTAYRDPWVLPVEPGARREATRVKFTLSREGGGGSDHLALVSAFNGWMAAKAQARIKPRSKTCTYYCALFHAQAVYSFYHLPAIFICCALCGVPLLYLPTFYIRSIPISTTSGHMRRFTFLRNDSRHTRYFLI
jgi:hypothetical protein